jgi:hypothetical protein
MSYQTKVYSKVGGDEVVVASGGLLTVETGGAIRDPGLARSIRTRATTAEVNAGLALLPAVPGWKYRIVDVTMIAIGGSAATATSVDIVATQGTSAVRPFVAAVSALTRSTVVKPDTANMTVLADGASFAPMDDNSGIYVAKQAAGSNLATATHIDVVLTYTMEAA